MSLSPDSMETFAPNLLSTVASRPYGDDHERQEQKCVDLGDYKPTRFSPITAPYTDSEKSLQETECTDDGAISRIRRKQSCYAR